MNNVEKEEMIFESSKILECEKCNQESFALHDRVFHNKTEFLIIQVVFKCRNCDLIRVFPYQEFFSKEQEI